MMAQIPLDRDQQAFDERLDAARNDHTHEIAPDIAYRRLGIVNVVYIGPPGAGDRRWVLVDAGLTGTARLIMQAAEERFGVAARPAAIVMTHGHFDHVGALEELAEHWDVPVYAHPLEEPYLNGSASYPDPDPSVGGGLMARLSSFYPTSPVDVGSRLRILPPDGGIPDLPDWQWLHTPGHAPGHISLWRKADKVLIAGDAFITTRQESAYAVATQTPEMHGPPMYFTPDWPSARSSVQMLADLEPEIVVTGHGPALGGADMQRALHELARNFDKIAVPEQGVYIGNPARAADGSAYR
ncbi:MULTISPECIES: MBL fold metallo-hydrolase [unclassified Aminobacter]|uniref:MBL fold metallo-hydrolase n=1 Tax=unclassified Aminobacter TaxID=2644704 RepID=UPI00119E8543|nr:MULTISPECIES: MBL fold metallo-hydrolase [unclassified Aminobacter]